MASVSLSKTGHNFICFAKVCVDIIKLPLIDILTQIVMPAEMYKTISNSTLTSGKNKLNPAQKKLCYFPPPVLPDYSKFDVTLLYTLIRNLHPSSLRKPTRGWGSEPRNNDITIGDDIERLRLLRNYHYGHAGSTEIPDCDFEAFLKKVEPVIKRFQTYTKADYLRELDKLENIRFGFSDLEKYKQFLEVLIIEWKQLENRGKPEISIKCTKEVKCGDTAYFEADVRQAETPPWFVTWHKVRGKNTKQIDTSSKKYRGSNNKQLVIHSVCREDEGPYKAALSLESNEQNISIFSNTIHFLLLEEQPHFDVWEISTEKEGITIHYSVPEMSGSVHIPEWTKDGTTLDCKTHKYVGGTLNDSFITIKSPTNNDKRTYLCTVTNEVGSVSKNVTLDAPRATIKIDSEVYFGSKTIVQSTVISCPRLNGFEWQQSSDGKTFRKIDTSKPKYYGSNQNPENPSLVITKTTFDDKLYYRLLVRNILGETLSDTLRLDVKGSPPNVLTNHEICIKNGSVRLIGNVFMNDQLPALKTICWTKDGKKVDREEGGEKYSEVSISNPSLTIQDVNRHDAGTYRLTAINAVGSTWSEIILDVPQITVEYSENSDGRQSFTAIIDSVPAAFRAQWKVKDIDEHTFTPIDVTAEVYRGTLNNLPRPVIFVKHKEHLENKCFHLEVENFVGITVKEFSGLPKVFTNHEICIENRSVRLIGDVFVNDKLPVLKTICWTKDGKKVDREEGGEKYSEVSISNPSLTIQDVNDNDAGTYRLTATNAVGSTRSEINSDYLKERNAPVVCAIELGTSYSCYAFSILYYRDQLNIEFNPLWSNSDMMTQKTPTCILFDKSGNFHSFGYEAESKYRILTETDEDDDSDDSDDSDNEKDKCEIEEDNVTEWLYFSRFRTKLFQDKLISEKNINQLELSADNGYKLPALKVFSEAIKYLKNQFETDFKKHIPREDGTWDSWFDDILWVLTVPAIWSDQAKQFMREAAMQAAIKDENLLVASEHESLAVLYKHSSLYKVKMIGDINLPTFEPGSKFMIVDYGEETVDVTAYRVIDNQTLKQLLCTSKYGIGEENLLKSFLNFLNHIFGNVVVEAFRNKSPSEWYELLRWFEIAKRGDLYTRDNEWINFRNLGLGRLIEQMNASKKGLTLSKRIQEMGLKNKIKCNGIRLRIDKTYFIEQVFSGLIGDIVKHLKILFTKKDMADIKIIVLAGEFSQCSLIQNEMKVQFPNKCFFIPRDGSCNAIKGAILFGFEFQKEI